MSNKYSKGKQQIQCRQFCGTELTQVPIRYSIIIIIIQVIILIVIFLDPITLMLLGDGSRAVEARSDVLLTVRNGFVLLNVTLMISAHGKDRHVCC